MAVKTIETNLVHPTTLKKEEAKSDFEKALLITTVALTALAFLPSRATFCNYSLRSISLISNLLALSKIQERGKKFFLESLKVMAVIVKFALVLGWAPAHKNVVTLGALAVTTLCKLELLPRDKKYFLKSIQLLSVVASVCGTLGLGGATYSAPLTIGALGVVTLTKMGLLELEEDEEASWQGIAAIVVNLFTIAAMIFTVDKLLLCASVVNLLVMGYLTHATFFKPKKKEYVEEVCSSAFWVMDGIAIAQKHKII